MQSVHVYDSVTLSSCKVCTFMTVSRSTILRTRNVLDKLVKEIETHFLFNNFFVLNRAAYEIVWKSIVEPDRPQMTKYGSCALHTG
jgi:hypothetical protein